MIRHKNKKGWQLIRATYHLLKTEKRLFLFPLLGYLCKYTLYVSIITPFIQHKEALIAAQNKLSPAYFLFIIVSFMLFLFLINLILFFFNAGIIENLLALILHQKKIDISFGFKQACKKYGYIYLWALYAGTFGICVNLIPRKSQYFKKTRHFLHHNHWSIAAFFALIQVIEKKYLPINALKKSSHLVQTTWGEQLRPAFSVTPLFVLLRSLAFLPIGIAISISHSHIALLIGGGITMSLLLLTSTCYQMLNTTIRVVSYCYVSKGILTAPFTKDMLEHLFM